MDKIFGIDKIKSISLVLGFAVFFLSCGETDKPDMSRAQTDSVFIDSLKQFISYSSDALLGGTVYVPVYSHIYQRNRSRTFNLTATLSIRNTDLNSSLTISKVYYYDSDGNLIHKYLEEPRIINPLSSTSFVVEEKDLRGGVGANFLIIWEAKKDVNKPIFEAVMISTAQNQGISFVSVGRAIHSLNRSE
ncbi:DUF3124 domain-containing protein [Fodinibius saliphilus]|uniref:DUF3124 domain-containing protein n=1 Tax=Fodinibius saliphilus TaxID=1920650 RepID=UPI001109BE19|nr:DUF3124 domain-containing protein [Fodinibius saliphilus]